MPPPRSTNAPKSSTEVTRPVYASMPILIEFSGPLLVLAVISGSVVASCGAGDGDVEDGLGGDVVLAAHPEHGALRVTPRGSAA